MINDIKDFKILKAVVVLDVVDVVDVLTLEKSPAEMALHDKAMFKYALASSSELNIPVLSDTSAHLIVFNAATIHRAEPGHCSFESARLDLEHASTNLTVDIDHNSTSRASVRVSIIPSKGTASKGF